MPERPQHKPFLLGLKTVGRLALFKRLIGCITRNTQSPYHVVVVATDGDHETIRFLEQSGISYIISYQFSQTVADSLLWYAFYHCTDADVMVSVEDDVIINQVGWERDWIYAAYKWGLMTHAMSLRPRDEYSKFYEQSCNTPSWFHPWWESGFGFQISSVSRSCLDDIGMQHLGYCGNYSDAEMAARNAFIRMRRDPDWLRDESPFVVPCMFQHGCGSDWSHTTLTNPCQSLKCWPMYIDRVNQIIRGEILLPQQEPWTNIQQKNLFMSAIDRWDRQPTNALKAQSHVP